MAIFVIVVVLLSENKYDDDDEIQTPFQKTTNRKWQISNGHVTDDVT